MIFRYAEFRRFIHHIKGLARVLPLCEWDGDNAFILRHDVDFDVDSAHRLAHIEDECGVRSTFFIQTTAHTYNPFSPVHRPKIREMAAMGFEIGIHFDPAVYGDVEQSQLARYLDREASLLATVTGVPVKSVSLHNPSVNGWFPLFEGYHNAYSKGIFSDACYISDSCMQFRGKDPYAFVENVRRHPVQILLHPFHFSEDGSEYPDLFYEYIRGHACAVDSLFRINKTYNRQLSSTDLFSYFNEKAKRT
ncbi:MAG: hypothetical protein ACLFOY_14100 [Desulfatibacillaceae bacterium]